jgi:hypothetical protein
VSIIALPSFALLRFLASSITYRTVYRLLTRSSTLRAEVIAPNHAIAITHGAVVSRVPLPLTKGTVHLLRTLLLLEIDDRQGLARHGAYIT